MKRFCFNQKGSVFILMAFTIPLLIAFSALAVDVGYLYVQRSHLQNIADAAALAGAAKLGVSNDTAKDLAETYIEKNSNPSDAATTNTITFSEENNTQQIRVNIAKAAPLLFMKYFNFNTVDLAVYAIASYSGSAPGIFDYSIISGDTQGTLQTAQGGSTEYNGLIHSNYNVRWGDSSHKLGTQGALTAVDSNIWSSNSQTIPTGSVTGGATPIDITESNPAVKAKIDSLTNKANTFSSSHPADVDGHAIDAFELIDPLYVNGNLTNRNIIPRPDHSGGTVIHDIVIVATGDISLNFWSINFSNTATITLISLTGNITMNGGNIRNLNMLAPLGSINVVGGGPTLNGYLIGQSVSLGGGGRTYQNSSWGSGGSGGTVKVRLVE